MNKVWAFFVLMAFPFVCFANSLSLFNDSPFTLSATILAADGTTLGQFTLNPQNGTQWSDQYEQTGTYGDPQSSQTPYTVIWYCPEGTEYGITSQQSPGSYVTASGASGNRACKLQNKPLLVPQQ